MLGIRLSLVYHGALGAAQADESSEPAGAKAACMVASPSACPCSCAEPATVKIVVTSAGSEGMKTQHTIEATVPRLAQVDALEAHLEIGAKDTVTRADLRIN